METMKIVRTYYAAGATPLALHCTQDIDATGLRHSQDDDAMRHFYQEEALRLCTALATHLPGGLFDALFAQMCARQASLLIVPHVIP